MILKSNRLESSNKDFYVGTLSASVDVFTLNNLPVICGMDKSRHDKPTQPSIHLQY